ncbi:hypothetical protein [Acinetobacter vivianii]|uniref:hypothetical protein n=1 Tax=Acinetobacter vivianii TaxID=1776742 RepID=UPI0040428C08
MNSAEKKIAVIEIGNDIWNRAKKAGNQIADGAKQVKDGVVSGGKWIGGALQGEFNDKATIGQIFIDAAISMFPVAGEVTAARDLVAVLLKMADDKKQASEVINWVKIILCLLPIIPIFGGILKGVGRLLIRVIKDASKVAEVAAAILAFLRKMGYGNSVAFIQKLNFAQYQAKILAEFKNGLSRMKGGFAFINQKMGKALPESVRIYVNSMGPKLDELGRLADKMIPSAVKELDQALNKVRSEIIRQMNEAGAKIGGTQTKVMTTEARLSSTASKVIASKGHTPAPLSHYDHKEGWPDLKSYKKQVIINDEKVTIYPDIHSFSSKAPIQPKLLKAGSKVPLFRVVEQVNPGKTGGYWAEKMSENGKAWRLDCAVKGAWSTNGAYVVLDHVPTVAEMRKLGITVPDNWDGLRVWRGKIAEQLDNENSLERGHKATNLLLPGGDIQIFINFRDPHHTPVKEYIDKMIKEKATGWTDAKITDDVETMVEYLEKRERSAKIVQQSEKLGRVLRSTTSTARSGVEYHQQKQSQNEKR